MNSAIVNVWGQPPTYTSVPIPPPNNTIQIRLLAAGQHQVVRSRAAGKHFTSGNVPHVPGIDGVGTILSLPSNSTSKFRIGQTVYFVTFKTGGSFSEILNVPEEFVMPVTDGADPVQVASLMNPAMSSWMALRTKTSNLPKDFTVLIMGVTSASGAIAIDLARHLGAGKVIGAARNAEKLAALDLDARVQLKDKTEETDFSGLGQVDVVLDYIFGAMTIHLLSSLKSRAPVQYVQIGGLSGSLSIELPGSILRSTDLTIRGCGPGSWSFTQLAKELPGLLEPVAKLTRREVKVFKLAEVEQRWYETSVKERIVYVA